MRTVLPLATFCQTPLHWNSQRLFFWPSYIKRLECSICLLETADGVTQATLKSIAPIPLQHSPTRQKILFCSFLYRIPFVIQYRLESLRNIKSFLFLKGPDMGVDCVDIRDTIQMVCL